MRLSTLTLAALALLAPFATANAAPQQVQAGVLQCQGGENVGFVVGSVARLECVFQSGGRRPEPYLATVKRIGVDLGFTGQTQLAWAVSAPTTVVPRGALAGSYGGVGVNATSPDELKRAVNAALDSGKPTLINAVIDPAAGSESGRIGNLNPQSVLKKK